MKKILYKKRSSFYILKIMEIREKTENSSTLRKYIYMMESIAVRDFTGEQYKLLEKKLQSCHRIINTDEKKFSQKKKLKIQDQINSREHDSLQKRFVSYTKPRKPRYISPGFNIYKAAEIEKYLAGSEGLYINRSSFLRDHM